MHWLAALVVLLTAIGILDATVQYLRSRQTSEGGLRTALTISVISAILFYMVAYPKVATTTMGDVGRTWISRLLGGRWFHRLFYASMGAIFGLAVGSKF